MEDQNNFEGQTCDKAMDYALFNISDGKIPEKFDGKNFRIWQ